MEPPLNIKGFFSDEDELRDVVRKRKICFDTEPYYTTKKGNLTQIGFQLNLYGTFPDEKKDYSLGQPKSADAVVANLVEPPVPLPRWKGEVDAGAPQFVSLGRYDIWHKGLDLAAAMVRALRQRGAAAQLHLHGAAVGRFEKAMDELKREFADLPIADHGVVSGPAKFAEMARYDFYLQYSRFELFGMAVMEAACAGVPLVLSENCDLAAPLAEAQAAIVLPMDPSRAADVMAAHLGRPGDIAAMAERGRAWRERHCSAAAVSARDVTRGDLGGGAQTGVEQGADQPLGHDTAADKRKLLAERNIGLELTEVAQYHLAEAGYDPTFGARPLKRVIQRELQVPLALALLQGEFKEGDMIRVDFKEDTLVFVEAQPSVGESVAG